MENTEAPECILRHPHFKVDCIRFEPFKDEDSILNHFTTKDSGDREEFDSGMVRDTNGGKPRFDLLIPKGVPFEYLYLTRIARLYERGAVKYAPRNWEKANSEEELDRAKESAFRHFMQWYAGEVDEDHAAAVFFNVNEVETIKTKLATAPLREELEQQILRAADPNNYL